MISFAGHILDRMETKSWRSSERGNFAIISAIILPVIIMIALGAVDYGAVVQTDQKMKADAEASVLAAVSETHIAYIADEKDVDLKTLAEETARDVFFARTGYTEEDFTDLTVNADVRSNVFTVEIIYALEVPSIMKGILDLESHKVSNSARARASATSYINVNMVFDVSGSMGIGSTPADQQIVADATGCAFACHTRKARGSSSYDTARAAGATMRIDTAREAAINAVRKINDDLTLPEQVTVGLHKFSNVSTEILAHDDAKSSDLAHVENLLNSEIQLDIEYTGTNLTQTLSELVTKLPEGGSGRTADDRIQYVVIMTDGIENTQACTYSRCWYPHAVEMVNQPARTYAHHEINYAPSTAPCKAMTDKNIHIYFVNTEYIVPTTGKIREHDEKRFGFIRDTLHDLVDARMVECTGDSEQVMRANSPQEIATAFERILGEVTSPLRLY